jgi:hypothetical protein
MESLEMGTRSGEKNEDKSVRIADNGWTATAVRQAAPPYTVSCVDAPVITTSSPTWRPDRLRLSVDMQPDVPTETSTWRVPQPARTYNLRALTTAYTYIYIHVYLSSPLIAFRALSSLQSVRQHRWSPIYSESERKNGMFHLASGSLPSS